MIKKMRWNTNFALYWTYVDENAKLWASVSHRKDHYEAKTDFGAIEGFNQTKLFYFLGPLTKRFNWYKKLKKRWALRKAMKWCEKKHRSFWKGWEPLGRPFPGSKS